MSDRDEELARLREAIERLEREQPSRFEQILDAVAKLLGVLFDTLFGRLRAEIEGARRAGEELVARVLVAVSRSLRHLGRALAWSFAALVCAGIGFVVLAIGLVALANALLGEPWGTLLVAAAFLLVAAVAGLAARSRVRAIGDEAEMLAPRWGR